MLNTSDCADGCGGKKEEDVDGDHWRSLELLMSRLVVEVGLALSSNFFEFIRCELGTETGEGKPSRGNGSLLPLVS